MSFEIVTDSSSNLPEAIIDQYGLHVLALEFNIEGEVYRSYLKGEVTDLGQFYTMMREGKVITTSLPSLEDVGTLVRGLFEAGKDVLYLGFDSALSGTYENTSSYMQQLQANEFPERKLRCVDTLAAALGQGLFVVDAVKKRAAGATLDEVADWAQQSRLNYAHWFTVEDLNYLQRGGRLSKGAAIAGTLLNIKPVLHVDAEGRLVPVEKVRGRKKSLQALYDQFAASAKEPVAKQSVYISHADALEDATYVAELIRTNFGVTDFLINDLDPVIGAHAGPGTIALFYVTDKDR
ncbi:MAG: DegV family protein [Coriobacteriales bacterium]|jgi:DegV family protein with EDD domain|nr:DegV family protein [Coriobacteriales bacterium]